jgi:transcriptional regulator with XRE-family HTH domain
VTDASDPRPSTSRTHGTGRRGVGVPADATNEAVAVDGGRSRRSNRGDGPGAPGEHVADETGRRARRDGVGSARVRVERSRDRAGLNASVGENVRRERQRAGVSLRDLARRVGVSPAFLSQFELGQSQAAVNTLFAIATELNLSIDALLGHSVDASAAASDGAGPGRRRARSEAIAVSDYLAFQAGVRWRRLAELPGEHVDFLLTEYEPGADSAPHDGPQRHKGNDYGYVLEGTLTVVVNGRRRLVRAGQAIAMRGDEPHRLRNESDELVRAIWFVVG